VKIKKKKKEGKKERRKEGKKERHLKRQKYEKKGKTLRFLCKIIL
jgi:hypothetical protein